ncbi:Sec63 Brl domain-containing protein [Dactylonectria macrodidyma]|uniref:Sec63 Brl domain-containing protein n=1 Tax=Dactylonectria macrodidyma TaxID=307937 RepID=A0A9P9FGW3_9HYPO|nr:Sec63 Brl domain-containing protein [Dactylonectria macrodidyma]
MEEPSERATCQMPSPSQGSNEIQLRYKLAPTTFKTLCTIARSPNRFTILKTACSATEFRSFPIKQAEKAFIREVNDHSAIPYPIKENITLPWHKVFLVIQLDLLRTPWPARLSAATRKELHQELGRMRKLMDRVLRCLVDILGERQDGKGVNTALDVLRSVKAGVWEGSEKQLLQVDGIGLVKMSRLVKAGIESIQQLSQLECYHIERLLSRNPPFGQTMLHELAGFPKLTLDFETLGRYRSPTSSASSVAEKDGSLMAEAASSSPTLTWIVRVVLGYANEQIPSWKKLNPWLTLVVEGHDGRLVWFWRGSIKRLVGGKEMVIGLSATKGEMLNVVLACEEIVGTIMHKAVQV